MFHLLLKPSPRSSAVYFSVTAAILVLLLLPVSISAQTDSANELWRERARSITDDLINDGAKLPPLRRAVLRARMAERWWGENPRRAKDWLTMAVETVEQVPDKENLNERRARVETIGLLLKFAVRLDRKLTERLVALLSNDDHAKALDRLANADTLITTAGMMVDFDAERAVELGTLALRVGPPSDVATLLFPLYRRNVRLADAFLARSLAVTKQHLWAELLNSLTYVVFAKERGVGGEPPPVPENARAELLRLDIAYLNANQNSNCGDVFYFITPVLSEFERLIPQQAAVARQAVNQCRASTPVTQQQLLDKQLNTVEEFLKAATDAKEPLYRATFEYRAANLARSNKDYDLAMKILDGMSKESREAMGGAWETYRWDWPAEAALDHYSNGRLLEMNRMLNGVPADWQPFAKTAFVDRLPEKRDAEGDPALQFLNDARTALRRSNLPESDKYGCYFVLLRLVVKYDPAAASTALKEAIASLNRAEQAAAVKDQKTLDNSSLLQTLPAALLEMDEYAVKDGLASMASVETRAQFRLDLLQAALGKIKKQ